MYSASVFVVVAAAAAIACGQATPPLSPTSVASAAMPGSDSQIVSPATKSTLSFAIHIFDAVTGNYVNGALVTAVGSDGVPHSATTAPPHGEADLNVLKSDASFDVHVTTNGYCTKDVVVPNQKPRWLWIGIQPGTGC